MKKQLIDICLLIFSLLLVIIGIVLGSFGYKPYAEVLYALSGLVGGSTIFEMVRKRRKGDVKPEEPPKPTEDAPPWRQ